MGVRYPARVVGGGGIYMEYDNRDVPDTATVVADFGEGCQFLISATMCNDTQLGEIIRGHLGTIRFTGGGDYMKGFEVYEQHPAGRPAKADASKAEKPMHTFDNSKSGDATYALYENFLECVRSRNRDTLCTPELGAAAFTTVNMGVLSYRHGKVLFWDSEHRKTTDVDPGWARNWEKRSKERSTPSHILGWEGGDKGSTLQCRIIKSWKASGRTGEIPATAAPADSKLTVSDASQKRWAKTLRRSAANRH